MSLEVDKYLAQKDQGFVAREPQAQHAGARRKRLPVRVSDTRCPPTMPFPADPGKDSRFIGRAGMELVHNVTAAEPTKEDDHCPRQSGNSMPTKRFVRRSVRTSGNFDISVIIAAR